MGFSLTLAFKNLTPVYHKVLLLTVNDLMCSYDQKIQIDIAVLDCSHALDTVPHECPLGKLDHYGIRGNVKEWI